MLSWHDLPQPLLEQLISAIKSGRLQFPYTNLQLQVVIPPAFTHSVSQLLKELVSLEMSPTAIVYFIQSIIAERNQPLSPELVWTGPEHPGSQSRDTDVVVRELFEKAQFSIILSSFSLDMDYRSKSLFKPIIQKLDQDPKFLVRFYLNIQRPYRNMTTAQKVSSADLVKEFTQSFQEKVWSGRRLPDIFYDRRSLESQPAKSCLHAKIIVVDHTWVFVTSANFTQASRTRNIEAGVLIKSESLAQSTLLQFEALVESKDLLPALNPENKI